MTQVKTTDDTSLMCMSWDWGSRKTLRTHAKTYRSDQRSYLLLAASESVGDRASVFKTTNSLLWGMTTEATDLLGKPHSCCTWAQRREQSGKDKFIDIFMVKTRWQTWILNSNAWLLAVTPHYCGRDVRTATSRGNIWPLDGAEVSPYARDTSHTDNMG